MGVKPKSESDLERDGLRDDRVSALRFTMNNDSFHKVNADSVVSPITKDRAYCGTSGQRCSLYCQGSYIKVLDVADVPRIKFHGRGSITPGMSEF